MVPRTKEAFDKWAEGFSNALQSREGAIPLDKDRMKVLFRSSLWVNLSQLLSPNVGRSLVSYIIQESLKAAALSEGQAEEDQERDDWWEELNRMHRNR